MLLERYGAAPDYREIYDQAVAGRLPTAIRKGRYFVRRRDLDAAASLFRLTEVSCG